jgi:DNA polymerase-3 subunit alpha (Gram-positive type)
MAYNIDFDYKFISVHSKKYGYEFDMKQIDVMYLARAFIPGLKNFKLSTVCKKLDVSLENAHRAVHDAMATAEVVIKLSKNIT